MEFLGQIFGLISLFSVIDGFEWFWMESLHNNIQLMLEFLQAPFWVLHFSYYTLMIFLKVLSVLLLSMLMILISVLSVIRHLIYETLWTGVKNCHQENWSLNAFYEVSFS